MTEKYAKLISKYALILAGFYAAEFAFRKYVGSIAFSDSPATNALLATYIPFILTLLLNLITVLIINQDRKNLNISTKYVFIATIIYRPIGVFSFLLFSAYNDKLKSDL